MRVSIWGALAMLVAATPAAMAQSSGIVRGVVTDPTGAVIPDATVRLEGTGSSAQSTRTDKTGAFRFYNVPFADYRLVIVASGFGEAARVVEVHAGPPIDLNVQLEPAGATEAIDVVAGEADHIVGNEYTIVDTAIKQLPTSSPSRQIEGVLLQLPGIVADENGRFHPRGAHYQASFVVDGVQISDQMSTIFGNNFDAQNIEGVNLIAGFIAPEYGNKVAAVINVASKSGLGSNRTFFGSFSAGAGSFSAGDASMQVGGQMGSSFGYFASVSYARSQRYLDVPFQDAEAYGLVAGGKGFHNAGNGQRYFARLDYAPTTSDFFKLTLSGGRSRFDVPNLASQQLAGQDQVQQIRDIAIYPSWMRVFDARWSLNVAPYYRSSVAELFSSPFDTPLHASQDRHLTTAGLNASLSYTGNDHNVKGGIDLIAFPISEHFGFAITDPSFNDPASGDFNPSLLPYDLTRGGDYFWFSKKATGHEYSAYVQDSFKAGNLNVSAGIRFDNYRLLQISNAWSPRVGVSYYFPTRTSVRFAYNRVFQTPSNENLLLSTSEQAAALVPPDHAVELAAGTQVVPAERGHWYEAGASQAVKDWFDIDVAYYFKDTEFFGDNDQFLDTGIVFPIALTAGEVKGLDVRIDVRERGGVSGNLGLSWSKAEAVPPLAGGLFLSEEAAELLERNGEPFRIDHDQPFASSFLIAWHRPAWGMFATLEGRYDAGLVTEIEDVEELRADPDLSPGLAHVDLDSEPIRVKPRFILNLAVGKDLFERDSKKVNVQLSVLNLTDQTRLFNYLSVFSGTHYIPPRNVSVRLNFEF
jgi:hypothetical protein